MPHGRRADLREASARPGKAPDGVDAFHRYPDVPVGRVVDRPFDVIGGFRCAVPNVAEPWAERSTTRAWRSEFEPSARIVVGPEPTIAQRHQSGVSSEAGVATGQAPDAEYSYVRPGAGWIGAGEAIQFQIACPVLCDISEILPADCRQGRERQERRSGLAEAHDTRRAPPFPMVWLSIRHGGACV